MFINILIYLCCVCYLVPNVKSQVIPSQTYSIYQQNGYPNPSASQPSDYSPYFQDTTVQNQLPAPNLSPSSIQQAILNRILSNPSAQKILEPIANTYGRNLPGSASNQISPNLLNNYFAAPIENWANNTKVNKEIKDSVDKEKIKSNGSKKRKSNRRKNQHSEEASVTKSNDNELTGSAKNKEKSSKTPIKRSSKNSNSSILTENNDQPDKTQKTKKRKNKDETNQSTTTSPAENKTENLRPRKQRKEQIKQSTTPRPVDNNNENLTTRKRRKKPKPENNTTEVPNAVKNTKLNKVSTKDISEVNNKPKNTTSETNKLSKLLPNLPEEYTVNLFSGMPNQYNNPVINDYFANYYQSILNSRQTVNNQSVQRTKPKKNRSNSKRISNANTKNSTNINILVTNKDTTDKEKDEVLTEKTILLKENPSNFDPIMMNNSTKSIELKAIDISSLETATEVNLNNPLENSEKYDSDLNNYGYIEDYYPNFMDSAAYANNNKQFYVKKLNDDKLFYTTDRVDTETIIAGELEDYKHLRQKFKDFEREKQIHKDQEQESVRNIHKNIEHDIDNEVITFKTPPFLETPDFLTRQIDKTELRPEVYYIPEPYELANRFVGDKTPSYSKFQQQTSKSNMIDPKIRSPYIETVYARSKVANYGPVYNKEQTYYNGLQHGGTMYVLAETDGDKISQESEES